MAITLEAIAAPGATPIAFNAASAKSFINNYYKLAQGAVTEQDRKTITIIAMAAELNHNGGADYTANYKGLRQDAMVYTGAIPIMDLATARAAVAWSVGRTANGSLSADVPTLLAVTPKTDACPTDELDRMIVFLYAQLGV